MTVVPVKTPSFPLPVISVSVEAPRMGRYIIKLAFAPMTALLARRPAARSPICVGVKPMFQIAKSAIAPARNRTAVFRSLFQS